MSGTEGDLFPTAEDFAEIQRDVNALAVNAPAGWALPANMVREVCELGTAAWPQYRGHLDGPEYSLVRIPQRVETKGGLRFEKGDVTLARRSGLLTSGWTAWSIRGNIDVGIGYVEALK